MKLAYSVARGLQLLGLILLPIAVAGNLAELANAEAALSLRDSLVLACVGGLCFYAGWLLQQRIKPH